MLRFLFPVRFRQWLGPLIVAGAGAALVAFLVVVLGLVDLSARKPHPDGWARFLHFTFDRSTAWHARGVEPPADLDSPVRIAAGAAYYGLACAHCHSGPGLGQNPVALAMHPRPQYLYRDLRAADFTAPELFRIVDAGVKYSAMPSWPADGRPDEVWQLVAFLRALPRMRPEQFRALALPAPPPGPTLAFGTPALRRYAMRNDHEPPVTSFNYRYPVLAFGDDPAIDDNPVATCARCHGADGAGRGAFPNLTIQDRTYLANTLTAFADGRRQSGFMRIAATTLSPQQIGALADHYAGLPRRATTPPAAGAPVDARGQQLALVGDKRLGLGPCAGCHGVTRAAAKAYPLLDGQSGWYVANQMRVFKAGGRGQVAGENPMPAIARKLDEASIEAVARYYAAQPPTPRQSFAAVGGR